MNCVENPTIEYDVSLVTRDNNGEATGWFIGIKTYDSQLRYDY